MKIHWMRWFGYLPSQVVDYFDRIYSDDTSKRNYLKLTELEARVLLSATPFDMDLAEDEVELQESDVVTVDRSSYSDPFSEIDDQIDQLASILDLNDASENYDTKKLIFVDQSLNDLEQLLSGLDREQATIVFLNGDDDIESVTRTISQYRQLSEIHFLTHGNEGEIQLGQSILNLDSFQANKGLIESWKNSLSAEADLLFYGCDVAGNQNGRDLLQGLANLTEAEIAASSDLTGHQSLGGDWDLEYQIGMIEARIVVSEEIQYEWLGSLATINVSTFSDEYDGNTSSIAALQASPGGSGISLREAITAANNTAGDDTIQLLAGQYVLTIPGGENFNSAGDLDVTSVIDFVGVGSDQTIIDGNSIDRVFDLRSGTGRFYDLAITGGNTTGSGGGILVNTAATSFLIR